MIKDEWQTPKELFNKLNDEFNFYGDVACTKENCICEWGIYKEENNSLEYRWYLDSPTAYTPVYWMNPPYSRGNIEKFCKKAYEESEKGCTVVGLLPFDCSTKWFKEYVWKHANEIRLLDKRVKFINPKTGKMSGSPSFCSCIVVWSMCDKEKYPKVSSYSC